MSTTYTGVESATQAPSATPGINVAPTAQLPADGDALTAASVAQMAKVAMDFLAYVNKTHDFRKTANDDLALNRNETSNSKLRWALDHNALPVNRTRYWSEQFRFFLDQSGTSGGLVAVPDYGNYMMDVTANGRARGNSATNDGSVALSGLHVVLLAGAVAGNYSMLTGGTNTQLPIYLYTSTSFAMSFEASLSAAGANNAFVLAGLRQSSASIASPDNTGQIVFYKESADTTWKCRTSTGAASTTTDSGVTVAATTNYAMRIEYHGSATQYAASTARFFINGSLVASHTTNLPAAPAAIMQVYQNRATGAIGANTIFSIGNEQIAQNYVDNPSHL